MRNLLVKPLLSLLLCMATPAFAVDGDVVHFEVSVSDEVGNNEAYASLSKTMTAKTPKELARQLNPLLNQVLAIAKQYPNLKVNSASPSGYPRYDDKGKVIGVMGSVNLKLRGTDMEAMSAALGQLQEFLVLQDLSFGVSKSLKQQTQENLQAQAVKEFQKQATNIATLWHAKSYRLIEASMNNSDQSPEYPAPVMLGMASEKSVAKLELEAGQSQLHYDIKGSIQLLY